MICDIHSLYVTTNPSAKDQTNIKLVQYDLENKEMANIIHFLKTFLLLILSEIKNKEESDEEMLNECHAIFDEMLVDAVSFCNNTKKRGFRTQLRA